MTSKTEELKLEKATIYLQSDFGFGHIKREVNDLHVCIAPYAQYKSAVHVSFRLPRARKRRGFVQHYRPTLVVLPGWGHEVPLRSAMQSKGDGSSETRHLSFSEHWETEFSEALNAYTESRPSLTVHDYRAHHCG